MLSVDLESVDSPLRERLAHECDGVLAHGSVRGTEIMRVPPADVAWRDVLVPAQPLRVLGMRARGRRGGERRPPELRLQTRLMNAVDERLHVRIAIRKLRARRRP